MSSVDLETVQVLLEVVSPAEGLRLKVLHNASVQTFREYKDSPTKATLANWKAAEGELAAEVEWLQGRSVGTGSAPVAWGEFKDTKVRAEVLRFLQAMGFDVAERTFFRHCAEGKLKKVSLTGGTPITLDDAELVKAVLTGRFQSGAFDNVKLAAGNSLLVGLGDTGNLDAFSRLRVSNPNAEIETDFRYDLNPVLFNTSVTGTGTVTHSALNSSALLTLANPGDTARLSTKQYYRYLPGKSHLVFLTGVFGAAVAGTTKRAGVLRR